MENVDRASRRRFLCGLSTAVGLFPALRLKAVVLGVRSSAELVDAKEPGQRLLVTGTVFGPDGKERPGVRLSVYHTEDAGTTAGRSAIRGSVLTDAAGRYELRTILPGHYFDRQNERHIHVHAASGEHPEHWIDSFLFAGDPYFHAGELERSRAAGRFGHVMAVGRAADGSIRCLRDIRLDAALAERNRLVNGWYRQ